MSGQGSRRLPVDQEARERAQGELDGCHVVEAGAGTGKTTVLVERVVGLVREKRATLDRVVVITFTEKAAGELKERLRARLEAEPGAPEPVLLRALEDLERAPIETIHAFAARILHERPFDAGVDPHFETLDALREELLLDEVWQAWLGQALERSPRALRRAYRAGVDPSQWKELGLLLVRERASSPPAGAAAGRAPDARAFLGQLGERVRRLEAQLAAQARDPQDLLLQRVREASAELGPGEPASQEDAEAFLLRELSLPGGSLGRKDSYRDPEAPGRARDELRDLAAQLATFRLEAGDHLLGELMGLLQGFPERYEATKRSRGVLDFQDLLLRARDLLRHSREARRDLAARYTHILVDEFQDTDPLQAELVFLLADAEGEARSWEEVKVPAGKLFLVGDPKQSIYRFRGADIELYERAKRALLGGREPLLITANFRSDAGLIEWLNGLFEGVMRRPPDGGLYQPDYSPLSPYHQEARGERAVVAIEPVPGSLEGLKAGSVRAREGEAIAGLLARAVAEGWSVRGGPGSARRAVRYGDMAVLLRAMTGIETYEEAFRRAGIPHRVLGGKDSYRRPEVHALLRLLEAVDDPGDTLAVVAACRSPLAGVSDASLLARRLAGVRLDYQVEQGVEGELGEAFRLLRDLHAMRHDREPAALIHEVLRRTHLPALLALQPDGEERVASLLRLVEASERLAAAGLRSLRSQLRHLRELESRDVEDPEGGLGEPGDDAVQVMTIHKAKGLEFPVVVLADLGHRDPRRHPPILVDRDRGRREARVRLRDARVSEAVLVTRGYAELREREERREEAESLRLLYVAATRARDTLVLPLYAGEGCEGTLWRALADPLARTAEGSGPGPVVRIPSGELPGPPARRPFRRRLEPPFAGGEVARRRLEERRAWAREREAALGRAAEGVRLLHPSDLGPSDLGPSDLGPAGGPRRGALPPCGAGRGEQVGSLVHGALERLDPARPEAHEALVGELVRERGLPAAAARRVLRLVRAAVESEPFREALRAERMAREVPVTAQVEGTLVEGAVDLIYEGEGGLVVVDWKTDAAAAGGDQALAELTERYRAQGLLYGLAVEAAAGVPVSEVVLLFLDGPGERAHAERLPFDEERRREVRARLRAGAGASPGAPRPAPRQPSLFEASGPDRQGPPLRSRAGGGRRGGSPRA